MKTFDLRNPNLSDVKYKIHNFPDGEVMIETLAINHKEKVNVICRITSPKDLFLLLQVGDILNRRGVLFKITILYLMSMRMDRVMTFEKPFSLQIVANLIKGLNPLLGIDLIEPHSETSQILLYPYSGGYRSILDLVEFREDITICFPDNGAAERYGKHYKLNKLPHINCSKERDMSGILSKFKIESADFKGGIIAVIDDLCDGGGTFKGIAKELDVLEPKEKHLYVTHAIQESGLYMLSQLYDQIYITDSYKDWSLETLPSNVHVINII